MKMTGNNPIHKKKLIENYTHTNSHIYPLVEPKLQDYTYSHTHTPITHLPSLLRFLFVPFYLFGFVFQIMRSCQRDHLSFVLCSMKLCTQNSNRHRHTHTHAIIYYI